VSGKCRAATAVFIKFGFLMLLVCADYVPASAHAQSICGGCEVQIGLGGTYHYWGTTGGTVLPVSVTWSESRYELGFFRVTTQQTLRDRASHNERVTADPYWGISLSRRWQLFESGPVKGFVGFGLAGKTKSDELSTTRWDFASQLGLPFRRSWIAPAATWANLTAAISAVHLATLAGCATRRGILAFDVQTQGSALTPDPESVLAQLRSPGLAALVAEPTLTQPWQWNLGDVEQLVYAIEFAHP